MCQIWLRSDGRVEKKGGTDRQTDKGNPQFYDIVDGLMDHGFPVMDVLIIILVWPTSWIPALGSLFVCA